VDARKGVISQTRRHAAVLALLGVPRLLLAVNKIDLVADPATAYAEISAEFNALTSQLGWSKDAVTTIPVSALRGDNVVNRSEHTPFYDGPTLVQHLEQVPVDAEPHRVGLRLPVQYVIRPRTAEFPDYRGFAGQIAAGIVSPGDEVVVLPSGTRTTVLRIDTADGELSTAEVGRSVTLILADEVDASRGDLIASPADAPTPVTELDATVCWLAEQPLRTGARVLIKHGTRTTQAVVSSIDERFDEQALESVPSPDTLELNEIGRVSIRTAAPLAVDDYALNRRTGSFLLIDPAAGNTLAAGLVGDALSAVERNAVNLA
ncbi:MAG: elongation factor 1-alpha C-terminal domain-related protein, partial [Mycobacteriaceae bacterium]